MLKELSSAWSHFMIDLKGTLEEILAISRDVGWNGWFSTRTDLLRALEGKKGSSEEWQER